MYDGLGSVEKVGRREVRTLPGSVFAFQVGSVAVTLRSASIEGDWHGIGERLPD